MTHILPYSDGHHKTVYSLVWPETEQVVRQCLGDVDGMLARHRRPHLKMQDTIGPDFAALWWTWAQVNSFPVSQWAHFYPTAGASEPIREVINELSYTKGALVVFEGEYEGYSAIAQANGTQIVFVQRADWRQQWEQLQNKLNKGEIPSVQWWLSQPSAINGCVWDEFDEFVQCVGGDPRAEVWVDFTYIGATPTVHSYPFVVPQYVTGVVFSLSKPFGVYYRRIGGCFSRRPVANLWGNMWFKNIDSIEMGKQLLMACPNGTIAQKYKPVQDAVLNAWNRQNDTLYRPSDVVLLAYATTRPTVERDDRYCRGGFYRVCLTPAMSQYVLGV